MTKFYWHEEYNAVYCILPPNEVGDTLMYVIDEELEDSPESLTDLIMTKDGWIRCEWPTDPVDLETNGFELIGEL